MKKALLLAAAVMLIFSACKKDEENNTETELTPTAAQKGFILEWTSITCGICGSSGGPALDKFSQDGPKGAMIALHVNSSDSMKVPNNVYWAFSEDRPTGGGIPAFYAGDTKTSYSDDQAVITQINSGNAVAGVAIDYEIDGNTMSIRTRTKFFQPAQGDYRLSVFVLEDGIDGSDGAPQGYDQAGGGSDYTHNCVWRASATSEIMGELIATDPVADSKVNKNYSVQLDPEWNDVYPVAVIWKHDDQASVKYSYVNSIRKK